MPVVDDLLAQAGRHSRRTAPAVIPIILSLVSLISNRRLFIAFLAEALANDISLVIVFNYTIRQLLLIGNF